MLELQDPGQKKAQHLDGSLRKSYPHLDLSGCNTTLPLTPPVLGRKGSRLFFMWENLLPFMTLLKPCVWMSDEKPNPLWGLFSTHPLSGAGS